MWRQQIPQVPGQSQARCVQRVGHRGLVPVVGHRHDAGNQAGTGTLPRDGNDGILHVGMAAQRGFDLGGFHPEAPQLELGIQPAEAFERTVRQESCAVTAAIQAARTAAQQVVPIAFRRQRRLSRIAGTDPDAADGKLPGDAGGHRLTARVEYIDPGIGHRPADGHAARIRGESGRVKGGRIPDLGGAVGIDQAQLRQQRPTAVDQGRRQGLAAADAPAQVGQRARTRRGRGGQAVEHRFEQRRDEHQLGDFTCREPCRQCQRIAGHFIGCDLQRDAMAERTEDFPPGINEVQRRAQRKDLIRPKAELPPHPVAAVDRAGVGGRSALGYTGGSRGVEDEGRG